MEELQQAPPQNPAPQPFKNRRRWLIAFGIVQILIACFFLLMAGFTTFAVSMMPKTNPAPPAALLYGVGVMYVGVAALFLTIGIGSIRAKNWARITTLALSWFWLVIGVFSVLVMALVMPVIIRQQESVMQQQPGARPLPDNFATIFVVIMLVVEGVIMILLPLVFILFCSNKNVRATCLATGVGSPRYDGTVVVPASVAAPSKPSLPLPIIILVVWFILGALSCAITALWIPIAGVMGHVLHGAAAHALLAFYALISAYCAWSFYRLRIEGWWVAVVFYGLSACSAFVSALRLDLLAIQRQAGLMNPESEKLFQAFPHFFDVIQFGSAAFALLFLVFILTTRRYFLRAAQ
jgi:hypothetical protein